MNFTVCYRDKPDGKVIRNWEKQCFPCEHTCLVKKRTINEDGRVIWYGGFYLYNCPHVGYRHKKIGQDTWGSQPRTRTDLVDITNLGDLISDEELESLKWKVHGLAKDKNQIIEIAEIPRDRWSELLDVNVPAEPLLCPICHS